MLLEKASETKTNMVSLRGGSIIKQKNPCFGRVWRQPYMSRKQASWWMNSVFIALSSSADSDCTQTCQVVFFLAAPPFQNGCIVHSNLLRQPWRSMFHSLTRGRSVAWPPTLGEAFQISSFSTLPMKYLRMFDFASYYTCIIEMCVQCRDTECLTKQD